MESELLLFLIVKNRLSKILSLSKIMLFEACPVIKWEGPEEVSNVISGIY